MSYRRMLISVGVFVAVTVTLLVFGVGYVIQQKGIFEKKFHFNLVAKSGADLVEGMPVLYSGFMIGAVTRLKLTDAGRVEVVIEIPQNERKWLKTSSIFYLNKPLIGSPTIVVESPDLDASLLAEIEEKSLITKDGINDLIGKIQPVLDDLQGIVSNVNHLTSDKADLTKILKHVELITQKLSQTQAVHKLDIMMDDASVGMNASMTKINAMLDDINGKLKKLDTTVDAVNENSSQLSGLTGDIKFSMKKADEVLAGLNGIIGSKPKGEVILP